MSSPMTPHTFIAPHRDWEARRKHLEDRWMPVYLTDPHFQQQVATAAQTLAAAEGQPIRLERLDRAFYVVASLWELHP